MVEAQRSDVQVKISLAAGKDKPIWQDVPTGGFEQLMNASN